MTRLKGQPNLLGAFTAHVFAELTSLVGLIKTENVSEARKRRFYQKTREGLVSGSLWDNIDALEELRDGYECTALSTHIISCLLTSKVRDNVSIDALCLFDTVASLGVPKVGAAAYIAPILRLVPLFRKDYPDFERIVRCPPKGKIYIRPPSAPAIFSLIHVYRGSTCIPSHFYPRISSDVS